MRRRWPGAGSASSRCDGGRSRSDGFIPSGRLAVRCWSNLFGLLLHSDRGAAVGSVPAAYTYRVRVCALYRMAYGNYVRYPTETFAFSFRHSVVVFLMQNSVILLYDALDVRRFAAELSCTNALALTPIARLALRDEGLVCRDTANIFRDRDHAACVAGIRHGVQRTEAALMRESDLGPAAQHRLRCDLFYLSGVAWRAWLVLRRQASWRIPVDTVLGDFEDRAEAHTALLSHLLGRTRYFADASAGVWFDPRFPRLFDCMHDALVRILRARGPWVITYKRTTTDLVRALRSRRPPVRNCVPSPTGGGGWRQLVRSWRQIATEELRTAGGREPVTLLPVFTRNLPAEQDATIRRAVGRVLAATDDPVVVRALDLTGRGFEDRTVRASALALGYRQVVKALRPLASITSDTSGPKAGPLAEACGRAGVRRITLNENPRPAQDGVAAATIMTMLDSLRAQVALSDEILVRSKPSFQTVKAAVRGHDREVPVIPVRAYGPLLPARRTERPLILHAGNSSGWANFVPLVVETSDEYLANTSKLIEAARDLPEVDFEIRLRRKDELNADVLARLVEPPGNVRITSPEEAHPQRNRDFLKRLSACDVLISFHSTTIEQALHFRKPVVLWGPVRRFQHVAGCSKPSCGGRAAVYVVERLGDLAPTLRAVVAAHRAYPLTDAELAPFFWTPEVPELKDLAAELAGATAGETAGPFSARRLERRSTRKDSVE